MKMMNNPVMKFWLAFARNTGEGGGASGGDLTGSDAGAGAAPITAGESGAAPVTEPTPPTTFLSEAVQKEEEPKPTEGEEKPAEAPAAFDLTAVKLPEGFSLAEEIGKSFAEILTKEALSPQERGQAMLDLHTKALQETVEQTVKQVQEQGLAAWTKMNDDWRTAIKELPEFKGNPDAEIGKVMQVLIGAGAGEEFFQAVNLTGAGNNPAILQVLHRLAQPYFEGGAVLGSGKPASAKRLGDNIYTSTTKA